MRRKGRANPRTPYPLTPCPSPLQGEGRLSPPAALAAAVADGARAGRVGAGRLVGAALAGIGGGGGAARPGGAAEPPAAVAGARRHAARRTAGGGAGAGGGAAHMARRRRAAGVGVGLGG